MKEGDHMLGEAPDAPRTQREAALYIKLLCRSGEFPDFGLLASLGLRGHRRDELFDAVEQGYEEFLGVMGRIAEDHDLMSKSLFLLELGEDHAGIWDLSIEEQEQVFALTRAGQALPERAWKIIESADQRVAEGRALYSSSP
mgnify:CR=1 FL=1